MTSTYIYILSHFAQQSYPSRKPVTIRGRMNKAKRSGEPQLIDFGIERDTTLKSVAIERDDGIG